RLGKALFPSGSPMPDAETIPLRWKLHRGWRREWSRAEHIAVSRALRRLEDRGLVIRLKEYNVRRTLRVGLTRAGREVAKMLPGESSGALQEPTEAEGGKNL